MKLIVISSVSFFSRSTVHNPKVSFSLSCPLYILLMYVCKSQQRVGPSRPHASIHAVLCYPRAFVHPTTRSINVSPQFTIHSMFNGALEEKWEIQKDHLNNLSTLQNNLVLTLSYNNPTDTSLKLEKFCAC